MQIAKELNVTAEMNIVTNMPAKFPKRSKKNSLTTESQEQRSRTALELHTLLLNYQRSRTLEVDRKQAVTYNMVQELQIAKPQEPPRNRRRAPKCKNTRAIARQEPSRDEKFKNNQEEVPTITCEYCDSIFAHSAGSSSFTPACESSRHY